MSVRFFLAGALLLTASAAPAANLITFEEPVVSAMSNSPGASVPAGARLSAQYLGTLGVSFTSTGGYAAVVDHGFPSLTPSGHNIIGGTNANGELDYASPIKATFFDPANGTTKATTNFVRVLGDLYGLGSGTVTMSAFDINGALLGSVTDTDNKPLGQGPVLSLSLAGIHYVTFSGTSGTVGFDNFEFNSVRPVGGVPEPAAWAMLLAGFGVAGTALRARRSAQPSHA